MPGMTLEHLLSDAVRTLGEITVRATALESSSVVVDRQENTIHVDPRADTATATLSGLRALVHRRIEPGRPCGGTGEPCGECRVLPRLRGIPTLSGALPTAEHDPSRTRPHLEPVDELA